MATCLRNDPLRHIRKLALLQDGGIADAQLLDSFLVDKDEAAFEALVKRHGSMVLGVCRRILKNSHDADDAFQATFLVLVSKAATISKRELLGNWLYGVAFRAALKMKQAETTRQAKERQVRSMPTSASSETSDEVLLLLDKELNKLPEKYRAAIVFCDLEGMTRNTAARKLGWPIGTLNWRLAKARSMVGAGLRRNGVTLSAAALAAVLQSTAAAAVPSSLLASTVKIGTLVAAGGTMASPWISAKVASLATGLVKAMFISKMKMSTAIVVMLGVLGAGVGGLTYGVPATETCAAQKQAASEKRPPAAGPAEGQFGSISIVSKHLRVDPANNHADVNGPGVLKISTSTSLKGEKLPEPETLTIQWNKDMFFLGKYADFHGGVQVVQGNAMLKCEGLCITLDRLVSFKKDQKENPTANIEKLVGDVKVSIEYERKNPSGKRIQFDRLTATQLTLFMDNQDGPIIAIGHGKVEHLALGGADDALPGPGSRPRDSNARPEQLMTLTRVLFEGRMFSTGKDNSRNAKFYHNVEVYHLPTEDADARMNPENPPQDGFYMRCNVLEVFTRQIDNKSNQMMKAEGNVFFRTAEFFGTSAVVKYDESQEQVIFEGTPGNPATLYKKRPGTGSEPREIKGSKILYNRKTGVFHLEGGKVISGRLESPERHPPNLESFESKSAANDQVVHTYQRALECGGLDTALDLDGKSSGRGGVGDISLVLSSPPHSKGAHVPQPQSSVQ